MATRLHIKIIEARDITRKGYMVDPYVTIRLKSQDLNDCFKTQVKNNNNNPVWNQEFDIIAEDPNDVLLINMYNEQIKNDVIIMDELQYPISTFPTNGPLIRKEQKLTLKKRKQEH